jgi:hypothetical protein
MSASQTMQSNTAAQYKAAFIQQQRLQQMQKQSEQMSPAFTQQTFRNSRDARASRETPIPNQRPRNRISRRWDAGEARRYQYAVNRWGYGNWEPIAEHVGTRNTRAVRRYAELERDKKRADKGIADRADEKETFRCSLQGFGRASSVYAKMCEEDQITRSEDDK